MVAIASCLGSLIDLFCCTVTRREHLVGYKPKVQGGNRTNVSFKSSATRNFFRRLLTLDLPGISFLTAAIFMLAYALSSGSRSNWSSQITVISLVISSFLLFWLFGVNEYFTEHAIFPLRIMKSAQYTLLLALMIIVNTAGQSVIYFIIFQLQASGHSAIQVSLMLLPFGLAMVALATVISGSDSVTHVRITVSSGFTMMILGY